jgi:hypothetical protein
MSPSERYEYDNYGIVPDDIAEKAKSDKKAQLLLVLGMGSAITFGIFFGGKDTKSR